MPRCCSPASTSARSAALGAVPPLPGRRIAPQPARRLEPHAAAGGGAPPRARSCPPLAAVRKTFASFDDMIKESPTPILVDFHAAWCGPCRLMSDSVAAAAKELGPDTVTVVKIDADAYPALASRFRVAALPTLLLFRGGAPVDRVEGYLAPADLAQRVRYYCQSLDLKFGRR